jgi:deoxyribose-phosphate aldolase
VTQRGLAGIREPRDLARFIDHTLLALGAAPADVARVCAEAREHHFAAVCVRPEWVRLARELLEGTKAQVAAVIDFHEGTATTPARIQEASAALRDGAQELDLVAPLAALRAGQYTHLFEDLRAVIGASTAPVKVILETVLLTPDQKVAGAAIAVAAGAAFVKTSTGFAGGGATVEDVALLKAVVADRAEVKASGGVRTAADALAMIRAGATRIGTSAGVAIVTGKLPEVGDY